jgi:hypothetical protein
MTVWMFYRTDGDSGYYAIKLFYTKAQAEAWLHLRENNDGYGNISEIEVSDFSLPFDTKERT